MELINGTDKRYSSKIDVSQKNYNNNKCTLLLVKFCWLKERILENFLNFLNEKVSGNFRLLKILRDEI